ncbi:MAG: DM13 domain-containing protein [Thermosynechococcaceae cyanobacterium]
MKFKYGLLFSFVTLLMVACAGIASNRPVSELTPSASLTPAPSSGSQSAQSLPVPEAIASGTFVKAEQPTQGTVRIVRKNGKPVLELDATFKTSEDGPDLFVILHRSANVLGETQPPAYALKEGDYAVLGPLAKFSGAQSYVIPDTIDPAAYKSAAIWCRKFNATFGVASLN